MFANMDECLWTEEDTAKFLQLSTSTVRKGRMTGKGGPPFLKLGASVRYVPSAVREWCETQSRRSTSKGVALTRRPRRPA